MIIFLFSEIGLYTITFYSSDFSLLGECCWVLFAFIPFLLYPFISRHIYNTPISLLSFFYSTIILIVYFYVWIFWLWGLQEENSIRFPLIFISLFFVFCLIDIFLRIIRNKLFNKLIWKYMVFKKVFKISVFEFGIYLLIITFFLLWIVYLYQTYY